MVVSPKRKKIAVSSSSKPNQAGSGDVVLPTVRYEADPIKSFDLDNCDGTSTCATWRALKIIENLSPPCDYKYMLGSYVGGYWLALSKWFCGFLPKQDDTIILVDEDEQEYSMKYFVKTNGLGGGWRGFSIAHKLRVGDVLIFQLVEPHKIKVHIVRASGSTEVDGAGGQLNSVTETNPVDDQTHILSPHNAIVTDQSGKIHKDLNAEDVEHIKFSQTNIKFNNVKCFKDFNIHVNGLILDSEIPAQLRIKYYNLCCSQNKFLHENLIKGLTSELVTGMISEIVSTADAIKCARLTTPLNHLETRDKTLKAFEDLGMAVGFLRSRIHQLVTLSQGSQAINSKRKERDEAEGEMKALEAKILDLKAVVKSLNAEVQILESQHQKLGVAFRDAARAAW